MTRDEAIKTLIALQGEPDIEGAHVDADDIICRLLIDLGYKDVVDAWEDVPRWYA